MSALGRVGSPSAWEADALPLDDTRNSIGFRGFYSQTVWRVTVGW